MTTGRGGMNNGETYRIGITGKEIPVVMSAKSTKTPASKVTQMAGVA